MHIKAPVMLLVAALLEASMTQEILCRGELIVTIVKSD